MKKDLPENNVQDIAVAIVLEEEQVDSRMWKVYLLNLKSVAIQNVMISSMGYGNFNGEDVKTSVFRHFIGDMLPGTFRAVEAIDEQLFAINNEFWLSYYIDGTIYDKKFIFLTESVTEGNFIRIPLLNKPGVMIR